MQTENSISSPEHKETTVLLIDEKLNLDRQQSVVLFVLLAGHEIAAALFSARKSTFLALAAATTSEAAPLRLRRFLDETNLLQLGVVQQSRIIVTTEQTLLPSSLYRRDDAGEILSFHFGPGKETSEYSQKIRCIDAHILYRVPDSWSNACRDLLKDPTWTHQLAGLTEAFFLQYKNRNGSLMLLHMRPGFIDILVKNGRQLIFANSFPAAAPNDVLYHTLNVYEQLGLNPESDSLILAGDVEKDSALYGLLSGYILQPEFAGRPAVADYSYVFDRLSPHRYFSLFSQVLCES